MSTAPLPKFEFPTGLDGILEKYGDPRPFIIRDGPNAGDVSPAWSARILVPVDVPWTGLMYDTGLPDRPGAPRLRPVTRIWCHRELGLEMGATLRAIKAAGLHTTIQRYGGCYNWRKVRGSSFKLSCHCWGIALDLDPQEDPLGDRNIDQDPRLVALFESRGWTWGGRWARPDGMHYQAARGY